MIAMLANTAVSLLLGMATGYFFEFRSSKKMRNENIELNEKLRTLRESIYSIGRGDQPVRTTVPARTEIESVMEQWVIANQGPDGTVKQKRIVEKFLGMGYELRQINVEIGKMQERGYLISGQRDSV